MNSEELEMSLRSEFESYLKNVLAEMKHEISQLQEKVTDEIERHKAQLDDVFKSVQGNFEKDFELDASFKESIIEHLRLSKDEGAQITAMAIAKAEELEKENKANEVVVPALGIKEIHLAINDISSKTTQSEILKTLVHHASDFAPRGAFFIVKNEHLIGWRVFGKEKGDAEERIREVFLPTSANSVLSESVKSLSTVSDSISNYSDDLETFQKLEFEGINKAVAIPLVARGRGVAVLCADYGTEGGDVNLEALETLVRVAGLTVEVLASGKVSGVKKQNTPKTDVSFEDEGQTQTDYSTEQSSYNYSETIETQQESFEPVAQPVEETNSYTGYVSEVEESSVTDYSSDSFQPENKFEDTASNHEQVSYSDSYDLGETSSSTSFETPAEEPIAEETYQTEEPAYQYESNSWSNPATETSSEFSAREFAQNFAKETDPVEYAKDFSYQIETTPSNISTNDYEFETSNSYQEVVTESFTAPQEEIPTEEFVPTSEQTYNAYEFENGKTETVEVSEPAPVIPKSRLSERNVDLPIEVTEDERRLHNDARRFARLLVSEIKLYNEQKVKEGRDSNDLYERLKEAIDRSREMYDKRVQPQVAAKFDYFHYELVNTLGEGEEGKLGAAYPGSAT